MSDVPYLRSVMSTPGQRPAMIDKVFGLVEPPDGMLLDLEDAVPPTLKDTAREAVAAAYRRPRTPGDSMRIVRVNGWETGRLEDDVRAIVQPNLDGICLPKVERVEEVRDTDELLTELEASAGVRPGATWLLVSIESAKGLLRAPDLLAASPRVLAVFLGSEDFSLDIGLPVVRGPGGEIVLGYARSAIVMAAASARVQAVDYGNWDFRTEDDLLRLRRDAEQGREMGFTGKWCIHPAQVKPIHDAFTPRDSDVELARQIVSAFDDAITAGLGAAMMGGQLIELPIVERARQTIRVSEKIAARVAERRPAEA